MNLDKIEEILKQLRTITDPGRESLSGPFEREQNT
jgi:hypothetical protein